MKKEERTMDKREYYLYVKGKAVAVSEEVYRAYWKITEHEKYLQRKGRLKISCKSLNLWYGKNIVFMIE